MNSMTESYDDTADGGRGRGAALLRNNTLWTLAVLVVLFLFFAVLKPAEFATTFNIRGVLTESAILLVLAVGMTYVIVTAGIDLSVGSILVFSGVVAAKTMVALGGTTAGWGGILLGALAGVGCGLGWGIVNGLLVAKAKVPPLIATLGTLGVSLGLAQVITNGSDVNRIPAKLSNVIGFGLVAGVPWLVVIAGLIAVLFGLLLALSRFGRHTYAIGSNAEASRRVGIKVDRHLIKVYALSGLLSGVAGVLSLAHYSTTTIASHTSDNLGAIAAVVIGGASLFGGVGGIGGTVIGVLIPGVLRNGLIILGAQRFWLDVAVGAVLVVAVYFDQLRRRARERE
ncbi:ABC transporter permease [Actinoallomurus soli]|uniref:ABC transporter permease n=1 Tax=Actinoallomurus soli TaxID=2952535 RepID=UPI002092DCB2|nr:ABC transporter permease [Actinoallomurus soli]MCO5970475.1 ABC transporter permease [Actinoallomurus soli]